MTMESGADGAGTSDAGESSLVLEGLEGAGEETGDEVLEGLEGGEPESAPRKFKPKVDGKEVEVDEATLLKDYELRQASHKRMEEASRLRKEAETERAQLKALLAQAKEDPRVLFQALGLEARPWAERLLTEQLELDLLSPEEKELRELRAFKAAQEAERVKKAKEDEEAQKSALAEQAGLEIESEVVDALKNSGLKPTPRTVARVAEMILASLEGEGPRMKATDALERLQREYRSDVADHLESMDPETLAVEYPSLYQKILEHSAKRKPTVPTFERGTGKRNNDAARKPKSWDEWLKD